MVRLFNILDYWAQLAQRRVALPGCLGYRGESPDGAEPVLPRLVMRAAALVAITGMQ